MAEDLLDIVETNGASVHAMDDARVISSALFSWCLVATFFVDRLELSTLDGSNALEVFIDQLRSESVRVKVAACQAIGLIYEANRLASTIPDISMSLQTSREKLAPKIRGFLKGACITTSRSNGPEDPRLLKKALYSLHHALVNNCGPVYRMIYCRNPDGFCTRYKTLRVRDNGRAGAITTDR